MDSMTKKQFVFSLIVLCFVLVVSLFLVFSIGKTSDESDEETKISYETLYEPQGKVNNLDECFENAKNFRIPVRFNATVGKDLIGNIERKLHPGLPVNSLWLNGNRSNDMKSLYQARRMACQEKIPVIVVRTRPGQDLMDLSKKMDEWNYYKSDSIIKTWAEYDRKLGYYIKVLESIPSIVVVEPDLLMMLYDQKTGKNILYEQMLLQRIMDLIRGLPKSWIYIDIGNVGFLREKVNDLNRISVFLTQLQGLRGFVINSEHFFNDVINEFWARKIYCRTGLHYVIDTSRNGGEFSQQNFNEISSCAFDPPNIKVGARPGWAWGVRGEVQVIKSIYYTNDQKETADNFLSQSEASKRVRKKLAGLQECLEKPSKNDAHDANLWIKNPGEADGRLYEYGQFHSCLIGHQITCSGSCQMISSIEKKYKPKDCDCKIVTKNYNYNY